MTEATLLTIPVNIKTRKEIMEIIKKNISGEKKFLSIVSLNPEILVIAQTHREFKKILSESDIQICDGIGAYVACRLLNIPCPERISGVDLMEDILQNFDERSLCIVLIGGKGQLASTLAECYKKKYTRYTLIGLEGYKDVNSPTPAEEKAVLEAVSRYKPDIVFAAFGSPAQELWFERHRAQFSGAVCMGVGGAFDFLAGDVPRAPRLLRSMGLEWLYRLIRQPWRVGRQLRLAQFIYLVATQKLGNGV